MWRLRPGAPSKPLSSKTRTRLLLTLGWVGVIAVPDAESANLGDVARQVCTSPQFGESEDLPPELDDYLSSGEEPTLETYDYTGDAPNLDLYQLLYQLDRWPIEDKRFAVGAGNLRIRVAFRDGSPEQKEWVQRIAPEWGRRTGGKFVFEFGKLETAHIRVAFAPVGGEKRGNWSEFGKKALHFTKGEPTMMLEGIASRPSTDYERFLVLHEFGHALGLRHEHKHPDGGIDWDEPKVRTHFKELGYSDVMINEQVLNPYTYKSYRCKGSEAFDPTSVMIYPIPSGLLKSGNEIPLNAKLSTGDISCVTAVYAVGTSRTTTRGNQ